ncbi:MAG: hydrogenase maturation nickel metallochaperone HypA [Anaerolineales bacterium]|nr:hydrogenase maturation nickel metallochaperone HypA [Anaerolineales bacterium]
MRETLTVEALLKLALQRAKAMQARRIRSVQIALGELTDFSAETLQTEWDELSKMTPAAGAELHVRRVTAEAQCMTCFNQYHPAGNKIVCPQCGGVGGKIIAGEEFFLESIQAE